MNYKSTTTVHETTYIRIIELSFEFFILSVKVFCVYWTRYTELRNYRFIVRQQHAKFVCKHYLTHLQFRACHAGNF